MSTDADSPAKSLPILPTVIVKNGTTPSSYDKEVQFQRVDAERRRAHQDALEEAHKNAPEKGAVSHLGSHRMITAHSPRLVLFYMNADHTVRQECKSELMMADDGNGGVEMTFALVCPRCLERGLAAGNSQMLVRERHRKFHIDERSKGKVVILRDPWGNIDPVIIAGTVTCDDVIRCSSFSCNWSVRIHDSKVYEV